MTKEEGYGIIVVDKEAKKLLEDFLKKALENKSLYDREPSKKEYDKLLRELSKIGAIKACE